ncbi:MAG: hypothetical protein FLDDKLPJ_01171 [Phycisphaerae bacterium]|nr:hypothetical protein [Phycisphaerae bacterium]
MKGIEYITNDRGAKRAVVLDLKEYGELWEDVFDTLVAWKRRKEPRESLASVKRALRRAGKLPTHG